MKKQNFSGKLIFCFLCMIFLSDSIFGENSFLKLKSRLKVSVEIDNNIGEDYNNGISDKALKVFSNFEASGFLPSKTYYKINMNGGLRIYSVYERENRFISNMEGYVSKLLPNKILVGINGILFFDKYDANIRDNNSFFGEGFISIPKSILFLGDLDLNYQNYETDYKNNNFFNFSESRYSISIRRRINSRTSFSVFTKFGIRDYERNAFENKNDSNFYYKDEIQNDKLNEMGVNLQYFKKFLIQAVLLYRNNLSNSYGFSFVEEKLSMILGRKIFRTYMFKLYFDIGLKRYKDPGEIFIIVDLDEDKEQDNRSIVEVSKSINENIDFEVRMEWRRNESRFRKLYYSKYLFSTGFLYKFH